MRSILIIVVSILFGIEYFVFAPNSEQELRAFEGSWQTVSDDSTKTSWIRFWMVSVPEAKSMGLTPMEGHFESKGMFGEETTKGAWNYASWRPLQLNIVAPNTSLVAAIKLSDDGNQLILLASEDYDEVSKQGWEAHPNAIKLERIN